MSSLLSPLFSEPITTQQRWDRRAMGALWKRKAELDPQTASFLDGLYKGRKKGTIEGSTIVTYKLKSDEGPGRYGYGRFVSSAGGLEKLENECRGTLCDDYYHDIDIVNCHPSMLYQVAKLIYNQELVEVKKYCDNRDEYLKRIDENRDVAKTAVITIMYGGACKHEFLKPFQKEVDSFIDRLAVEKEHIKLWKYCQKKPLEGKSAKGSFLSYLLQTLERKVMLHIRELLTVYGWQVDVLTYDGVMIRKKEATPLEQSVLTQLEESIKKAFNLDLKLKNKAFEKFELSEADLAGQGPRTNDAEQNPIMPMGTLVNDAFAAREFARLMGDNLVFDSGVIYFFDNHDGMWKTDAEPILRAITSCGWRLVWKVETAIGISTHDYSGSVKNSTNLLTKLPHVLPIQNGYMKKMTDTDYGLLLWADGIYDFRTDTFTPGFNRDVYFTASIPRPFPRRNDGLVEFIRHTCFDDPFVDKGEAAVLRHNLMRALIGDFRRKKIIFGLGLGNSGKSLLILLCKTAFAKYVNSFNGNDLLKKRTDGESSRTMGWLSEIVNGRFAFGTEITLGENEKVATIDANMLKSISSGGDDIVVREIYQKKVPKVNRSTFFMFGNAMPKIVPVDDGVRNRVESVTWEHAYVDEPTEPWEKKKNPELSGLFEKTDYGDALFWLLVEDYKAWKATGYVEPQRNQTQFANEILPPKEDYMEILLRKYKKTDSTDNFVMFNDIQNHFKNSGVDISPTALGLWLRNYFEKDKKKISGRTETVYLNLAPIPPPQG